MEDILEQHLDTDATKWPHPLSKWGVSPQYMRA